MENAPRSDAVIVSCDHSLTKRVKRRLRTSQLHKTKGKDLKLKLEVSRKASFESEKI